MQFFLRSTQPAFWPAAPLRRTSVLPQAKPWRRANSLRPSISVTEGWSDQRERNPKENATCRNKSHFLLVDSKGIEPSTSAMRKLIRTFFALFLIIYSGFRSVSLSFRYSLELKSPCGTPMSVVAPVVRNAPQPLPAIIADRDGEHFHTSDCLHCNSEDRINQVIFALTAAQNLGDCKQKIITLLQIFRI